MNRTRYLAHWMRRLAESLQQRHDGKQRREFTNGYTQDGRKTKGRRRMVVGFWAADF